MRRLNHRLNALRGAKRYSAWVAIGCAVGFILALLDHLLEPDRPLYVLVVIGLIAGLAQAFYSERVSRKAKPPDGYPAGGSSPRRRR